jgi:membrane-associated phospholipid phosphatase
MLSIFQLEINAITILQKYCSPRYINPLVKIGKLFTNKSRQNIWLILLSLYDKDLFIKIFIPLMVSREVGAFIKNKIKINRPYVDYSNTIVCFKKKKYESYSFPSQSNLNLATIYYTLDYHNYLNIYLSILYYFLISITSITRMYRGLHYPHDILISNILGKITAYNIFLIIKK